MVKNYYIKSGKNNKQIIDVLPHPCIYNKNDFGLFTNYTGKNVKIGIIDTGMPDHADINNITDHTNFGDQYQDETDKNGHCTMMCGILTANNQKAVTGVCQNANILTAKVVNIDNDCSYNNIVSSILWMIVKEVNIIVMSFGSDVDYNIIHDAIRKAYQQNICIFTAYTDKEHYPSSYPEVLSINRLKDKPKNNKLQNNAINVYFPYDTYTTYLHGRYIKAGGSSIATSLVAGLASIIIEQEREKIGQTPTVNQVYSDISNLFARKN